MIDVFMFRRRVRTFVLGCLACLVLVFAMPAARADNLPRPRVTGPAQVNNRAPLTLRFIYPPQHWSRLSFWHLWYWTQYWHCQPGKDSPPTEIALQTEPWAGRTNPCTRADNRYLGLSPQDTGDTIRVPREGGIPAIGTWYVRVRLVWRATKGNYKPEMGPWSAWHHVAVVQSFKDAALPPKILAPANKHLYAHRDVDVRVMAARRHPNPARWEYAFEWQRAAYHTRADNAYAHPHPKPTDFPRVLGLASPFRPWSTGMQVHALAESATPSSLHLGFSGLATGRHDTSYIYRFRVRERLHSGSAGPWSGWRSFIVTDPVSLRVMPHPTMRIRHR